MNIISKEVFVFQKICAKTSFKKDKETSKRIKKSRRAYKRKILST